MGDFLQFPPITDTPLYSINIQLKKEFTFTKSTQHISWTFSVLNGWLFEQKGGTICGKLDFFLVHMNG